MDLITRLEEAILVAILYLNGEAYGLAINKQVSRSVNKDYSMGALYFALDRLYRNGYIGKSIRHVPQKKGGRSRTYYQLKEKGQQALREVRSYQIALWDSVRETAGGGRKGK